jgi:hypothetical protein
LGGLTNGASAIRRGGYVTQAFAGRVPAVALICGLGRVFANDADHLKIMAMDKISGLQLANIRRLAMIYYIEQL